jgi:HK97 gp10 family phage protein
MEDFSLRWDEPALHRLLEGPDGPIAKDLSRRAMKVHRVATRLCPVDTGRLRASITWMVTKDAMGLVAIIGTNVEYAIFVEFGTIYMEAQPFLRPALREAA